MLYELLLPVILIVTTYLYKKKDFAKFKCNSLICHKKQNKIYFDALSLNLYNIFVVLDQYQSNMGNFF